MLIAKKFVPNKKWNKVKKWLLLKCDLCFCYFQRSFDKSKQKKNHFCSSACSSIAYSKKITKTKPRQQDLGYDEFVVLTEFDLCTYGL